jgi:hypothetical protein
MPHLRAAVMIGEVRDDDSLTQSPEPQVNRHDSVADLLADWSDGHPRFADRRDAGRRLAAVLGDFAPRAQGCEPRGGNCDARASSRSFAGHRTQRKPSIEWHGWRSIGSRSTYRKVHRSMGHTA